MDHSAGWLVDDVAALARPTDNPLGRGAGDAGVLGDPTNEHCPVHARLGEERAHHAPASRVLMPGARQEGPLRPSCLERATVGSSDAL